MAFKRTIVSLKNCDSNGSSRNVKATVGSNDSRNNGFSSTKDSIKSPRLKQTNEKTFNNSKSSCIKKQANAILESIRHSLISGAKVYVRLDEKHPNALWFQGDLVSHDPGSDKYKVDVYAMSSEDGHLESSEDTTRFFVTKANLALSKPSEHVLSVGTHVIASLISGIIAERPNPELNGNKYLVFLENGAAEYFHQSEVFQVAQGRYDFSNVSVEMPVHYRLWLQDYFERYPQRLRTKYLKNDIIQYNRGSYERPCWQRARITRAKRKESLIEISLESTEFRDKSIRLKVYQASPKLYKYHERVANYIKKHGSAFNPSLAMASAAEDQQRPNNSVQRSQVRASNYTLSIRRSKQSLKPQKIQLRSKNIETTLTLPEKGDKVTVLARVPPITLPKPRASKRHTCSTSCSLVKVDLLALRGLNPFFFPLFLGFRYDASNCLYISPCGIQLKSLEEVQQYLVATECLLDIDCFTFERVNFSNDKISSPHAHFTFIPDISNGLEFQPISLINFTDQSTLDPEFTYIADRILDKMTGYQKIITHTVDEDVEEADPFLPCCDCTDNCSNADTCACIQSTINNEYERKCSSLNSDEKETEGYTHKRLLEPARFGIYECNRQCPCNKFCPNRVVQNGMKCVLQIFMTPEKGWGVRSLYDIPRGTFVSTYAAKVMRDESVNELDVYTANLDFIECAEAHKEGYEESCQASISDESESIDLESGYSSCSPKSDSHAFQNASHRDVHQNSPSLKDTFNDSLPRKRISQPASSLSNSMSKKIKPWKSVRDFFPDEDPFVLDAQIFGNIGRFYNHSCDPNMFIQNVFIDTHDLRLPHVAFFTNRFVHAFDELTWDYSYEIDSVPKQIACKCGTDECRKRLL